MLSVKHLSIVYDRVRPAVPAAMDISLALAPGESLGIIGESGCGKTTLALGLMGLLREADIQGQVCFQGRDLNTLTPARRRRYQWRHMAMVFQNSLEVFNPVISLGEQLAEPLRTHLGMDRQAARRRVSAMLELTGLDPVWQDSYAHQLSGGMRQRALIAMALGCSPDLLIVDEPTTSLDPESRTAILNLIETLKREMGFALILISHNLPAVQQLTTRLMTLYAGRVVETGLTTDILRNPLHPYTRGLINAAPDFFPYKDLWGIPGAPPRPGGDYRLCFCTALLPVRRWLPTSPAPPDPCGRGTPGGLPQGRHRNRVAGRGPIQNLPQRQAHHSGPGRREPVGAAGGGRRPGGTFRLGQIHPGPHPGKRAGG